jgi:hypothetical protein
MQPLPQFSINGMYVGPDVTAEIMYRSYLLRPNAAAAAAARHRQLSRCRMQACVHTSLVLDIKKRARVRLAMPNMFMVPRKDVLIVLMGLYLAGQEQSTNHKG